MVQVSLPVTSLLLNGAEIISAPFETEIWDVICLYSANLSSRAVTLEGRLTVQLIDR
jgi:hypothetical protein